MRALTKNVHVSKVINSLETAELIASRTILYPDGFNGFRHYHDNAHFSFVLFGGCAEKKQQSYERPPGSVTWYPAGEPHQIMVVTQPSYHVNFELPPSFFNTYGIVEEVVGNAVNHHPSLRPLMLQVYRELDRPDSDSILSLQQLLLNLVQQQVKKLHSGEPRWVKVVRAQLADCWNENISLETLSRMADVHPVTISKYFSVYFSCTLGQYRRRLKVNRAIELLLYSPSSSAQIAYDCGFADESHFIRAFKEVTNMLPGQLRKWVRH